MQLSNLVICLKGGGYVYSTIAREGEAVVAQTFMEQWFAWREGLEGRKSSYATCDRDGTFKMIVLFEEVAGFYFREVTASPQERMAIAHEEMAEELKKQANDGEGWKENEA